MKRAMLLPVMLLGLSCSIHASHTGYPVRGPYRPASLVYELESATDALRRDAEYAFHHRSRYENRALKEVRRLHKRARDFRRSVERRYRDDHRIRRDFDRLMRQYYRTEGALSYAYTPRQVYRSLNYVRSLINRLQRSYGYYRY
jgi:hypothetical protein